MRRSHAPQSRRNEWGASRHAVGKTVMNDSAVALRKEISARALVRTILRFIATLGGIMSVVLIARDGVQITLGEFLNAVAIVYDDALSAVVSFLFEPIA